MKRKVNDGKDLNPLEVTDMGTSLHVSMKRQLVGEGVGNAKACFFEADRRNPNAEQIAFWARELMEALGLGFLKAKEA